MSRTIKYQLSQDEMAKIYKKASRQHRLQPNKVETPKTAYKRVKRIDIYEQF